MINFQVIALRTEPFASLFSKTTEELRELGAKRMAVTSKPGFPCRISLEDAEIGEEVILLPFVHHDVASPYRASGPIFIRNIKSNREWRTNEVPPVVSTRMLSFRGYDGEGMMLHATVAEGAGFSQTVSAIFESPSIQYIHVHNAKPGCFSCEVRRA